MSAILYDGTLYDSVVDAENMYQVNLQWGFSREVKQNVRCGIELNVCQMAEREERQGLMHWKETDNPWTEGADE